MQRSRSHTSFKVAALVGSLRRESFSRKVANALIGLATLPLSISIHADKLFSGAGKLDDESTREFFVKYLATLAAWIATNPRDAAHLTG